MHKTAGRAPPTDSASRTLPTRPGAQRSGPDLAIRLREHLARWLMILRQQFWLVPAAMVLCGALLALAMVQLDRAGNLPAWVALSGWLYQGSPSGAHALLGAVVASTIGVAGTVFSITIAALSLAAGQMGPRLMQNFTSDRGNQFTLGAYLGTFAYALLVLRSVDADAADPFVPQLALSVAILLTFLCVGTLIYFVGHMAGRINVDTVIELVNRDFHDAMRRLLPEAPSPRIEIQRGWSEAQSVSSATGGYLQHVDSQRLAEWADENGATVRLLARPGDHVFPGVPIALVRPSVQGAGEAVCSAIVIGDMRLSAGDLEDAVRRMVEVGVRALSPGINDPNTAISVLDKLGTALCDMVRLHMPNGQLCDNGRVLLDMPVTTYDGLLDTMFHMIRQSAHGQPAVLVRMLEVLTAAASCEQDAARARALQRHADLVMADAERIAMASADLLDVRARHSRFHVAGRHGIAATLDQPGN